MDRSNNISFTGVPHIMKRKPKKKTLGDYISGFWNMVFTATKFSIIGYFVWYALTQVS